MKLMVILGDGMADLPLGELQGKTPLKVAKKPNMDLLARLGRSGLALTVPDGFPPGSDVANLSVVGYDPRRYYTGRAPLEAASMGVHLGESDIAFRCNLVTIEDGIMRDYSAGHISTGEASELIEAIKPLMPNERLYAGVSYRHLLVLQKGAGAVCTPPHDISDQPVADYLPQGEDAEVLLELMESAKSVLSGHPVNRKRIQENKRPANAIWLWGQGPGPSMPSFLSLYGLTGAMISAVDLLRGIAVYAGLEVIEVPGATGTIDTNYSGKVKGALEALYRHDFAYLHVEAPDEASHEGDLEGKIRAIELLDQMVVGPVIEGLEKSGEDWRILLLPDHATPISIRTHSRDPVPFVIMGRGIEPDGLDRFDEQSAEQGGYGRVDATALVRMLAA